MNLSRHQQAILALIIANMIWGAASPIFKWALTDIQPFTLAFLRFFVASFIFIPFVWRDLKIKREDISNLLILSFTGITFNISFFFLGLRLAPSINAPIIATSGPIFLLIGSFFILRERLKKKVITGTIIGLVGVLLIILRPLIENGFDSAILGNFFFVLATFGGVLHTIYTKKIAANYKAMTITFWSFLIGATTFLPLFFLEIKDTGFLLDLGAPGIVGLLFGIFLSSSAAYYLYHLAIKQLLAHEIGVFTYLDPIIAILIAIPLLGEIPTLTFLLGSILVFVGILVAEGRLPYHPIQQWKETTDGLVAKLPEI